MARRSTPAGTCTHVCRHQHRQWSLMHLGSSPVPSWGLSSDPRTAPPATPESSEVGTAGAGHCPHASHTDANPSRGLPRTQANPPEGLTQEPRQRPLQRGALTQQGKGLASSATPTNGPQCWLRVVSQLLCWGALCLQFLYPNKELVPRQHQTPGRCDRAEGP